MIVWVDQNTKKAGRGFKIYVTLKRGAFLKIQKILFILPHERFFPEISE